MQPGYFLCFDGGGDKGDVRMPESHQIFSHKISGFSAIQLNGIKGTAFRLVTDGYNGDLLCQCIGFGNSRWRIQTDGSRQLQSCEHIKIKLFLCSIPHGRYRENRIAILTCLLRNGMHQCGVIAV